MLSELQLISDFISFDQFLEFVKLSLQKNKTRGDLLGNFRLLDVKGQGKLSQESLKQLA